MQRPLVVGIDHGGVFVEEHTGGVDETREGREVVPVVAAVAPDVIAQRPRDRQRVAGSGQRHVQKAPFLFESIAVGQRHVEWYVAVGGVDEMYRLPFATLGRMDGGQDEIVVVEVWLAREIGAAFGWIECDLRE